MFYRTFFFSTEIVLWHLFQSKLSPLTETSRHLSLLVLIFFWVFGFFFNESTMHHLRFVLMSVYVTQMATLAEK